MGQQITKEHGSSSGHGRLSSTSSSGQHRDQHHHSTYLPSSSSFPGLSASSAAASPPSPPPLPPHLSDDVVVDKGGLVPQGVYTGPQDYNQHFVRQTIVDRRLAPFCKGSDDEETYASEDYNSECPICFLYYPSPLNFSRCCHQPICTECFVQMKRADPNATNPPSSEPRSCPFCVEPEFGVTYTSSAELARQKSGADGDAAAAAHSPNDASDAADFAEMAIGTGGVGGHKGTGKKRVLAVDDPAVVTVDQVRPDWQAKLAHAQAAIARRANRRVIMRQVGDRLIPIGISSSRVGAELAAAAEDGRVNLNGPGGSIILQERPGWLGGGGNTTSSRRRGRGSRSEGPNTELARLMRLTSGEEMEEMMMMEAMRLSLLEHEEQQKREAEAAKKKRESEAGGAGASAGGAQASAPANPAAGSLSPSTRPASDHAAGPSASPPSTSTGADVAGTSERVVNTEAARPTAPPPSLPSVAAASLGLSDTTLAELCEIAGDAPPVVGPRTTSVAVSGPADAGSAPSDPVAAPSSHRPLRSSMPVPEHVPVPQPVASMGSVLSEAETTTETSRSSLDKDDLRTSTVNGYPDHSGAAGPNEAADAALAGARTLNRKNPFRRSVGESS
ncbi:SNF1-interacting protein [Thecaphora frezii]